MKMTKLNMLVAASIVTWGLGKAIGKLKGNPIQVSASENGRLIGEYIALVERHGKFSFEVLRFRFNHRRNESLSKMISVAHSSGVFAVHSANPNGIVIRKECKQPKLLSF
jgi:hypothetical protein